MYVCSDPCGLWIASSCEVVFSVREGEEEGARGEGVGEIVQGPKNGLYNIFKKDPGRAKQKSQRTAGRGIFLASVLQRMPA